MTIFIVSAIGADDIFVFMDLYKQSAYQRDLCCDIRTRMNWVYSRASWAMLITSATTCAAFICTALSPLPSIQSFGIFSAFVIAADYILVITWFPSCVILYHNYMENRPCCLCCCSCKRMFPCQWEMETTTKRAHALSDGQVPEKRKLEVFISRHFAYWLGKSAPIVIIVFLLLLIPFGILASGIQPLSRAEESLPSDHPFQRIWTLSGEKFPSSAQNTNSDVYIVWGVQGMNMDKVNLLRDGELTSGVLEWDTSFHFDEHAQQHIWNLCEEVRQMEAPGLTNFLSRDKDSPTNAGRISCVLDDWKAFLEAPGMPGFPVNISQVPVYMRRFLEKKYLNRFGQNETMKEKWKKHLGFDPNLNGGAVRMVMLTVSSQLGARSSHPSSKLQEHYDRFQSWIQAVNSPIGRLPAPASARNAYQTCDGAFNGPQWIWMHTQSIFRESAILGACIGSVLAFAVILLATQQIIIAVASFVTIACVLVSFGDDESRWLRAWHNNFDLHYNPRRFCCRLCRSSCACVQSF